MTLVQEILDGTGNDWQDDGSLASWLAGPAAMLQPVTDLVRDGEFPGWSAILDVTRCPTNCLPWLAQLVGVRLDPAGDDTSWRAAITSEQGFARGTVDRLRAAALPFLTGTQTVNIFERDTSPYHLTVTVYSDELNVLHYNDLAALYATYDDLDAAFATYDEFSFSLDALTAALMAAKPGGLQMTVGIVDRMFPDTHLFPSTSLYPEG